MDPNMDPNMDLNVYPITYKGCVYPWQCDQIGHMNIMWYVGKFDEANWNHLARVGLTPSYLRTEERGMAVELAIRQWSRVDETAAAVVARVDAARLKNVAMLYRALGLETEQAEAQALLFYSFIFGQSLLQMKHGARRQRELIAACSEALTALPVGRR